MIWRYALLDFVNDFCSLIGTFSLEVVPFGLCGLIYYKLGQVSPKTIKKHPEAV
jgi:hypothetical protein